MINLKSPQNAKFSTMNRFIISPKNDSQSMISILQDLDEKVENYSQRTKEILKHYSSKGRHICLIDEGENKDFKKRVQTLNVEFEKTEERTAMVLKLLDDFHTKKIMR